jgi:hypothetical protein
LLRIDDDRVCVVPRSWTDLAAADPEIVIGERRACLRVGDFVELARIVAQLAKRDPKESADVA